MLREIVQYIYLRYILHLVGVYLLVCIRVLLQGSQLHSTKQDFLQLGVGFNHRMQMLLGQNKQVHVRSRPDICITTVWLQQRQLAEKLTRTDRSHRLRFQAVNQNVGTAIYNKVHLRTKIPLLNDDVPWWHMQI